MRKILSVLPIACFAFFVLFTSIFRTAKVEYSFAPSQKGKIAHSRASLMAVTPDSPLWFIQAGRDKLSLLVSTNGSKKVELLLAISEHRLNSAHTLFLSGKSEVGVSVLTKAEKYLEEAAAEEKKLRLAGENTSVLLYKLSQASQKHTDLMEECLGVAPEQARPIIVNASNYPKRLFLETKSELALSGGLLQESPF